MKLKEIPDNVVVHTPTEEDAKEFLQILHENGYRWGNNQSLLEYTRWCNADSCYCLCPEMRYVILSYITNIPIIFLTLAEFKERYCEEDKPQPKFKVGDKVRIINDCGCHALGLIGIVEFVEDRQIIVSCESLRLYCVPKWLEPYTEPETKPTAKETKESKETFASEELNLCELLKGHEGEKFFSLLIGECVLSEITTSTDTYPIKLEHSNYSSDGKFESTGVTVVYPSRALYEQYPLDATKAWSVWQEEQKAYSLSLSIVGDDLGGQIISARFRTTADRDKCIEEIKAIIEKYSRK